MRTSENLRVPGYVPDGYRLWTIVYGAEAGGFGFIDSEDQYAVTYARGQMPEDKGNALTVFKAPPGASKLAATDDRAGEPVDLDNTDVTAVYHDGMWYLGPGSDERTVGRRVLHWDRTSFHSVTVRTSEETWGVRGPKNADIDRGELIKIARSLVQ